MAKPKEDPQDKKARLRERRLAEIDRRVAAEKNAAGLTADLRGIYGAQPGGGAAGAMPFAVPGLARTMRGSQGEGRTRSGRMAAK